MTATEILKKLKAAFAEVTAPAPAGIEAKLKDGTVVMISALEVGGTVTINGAPAPEGEHELEDGTKIVVDASGVITAVTPYEEPVAQEDMKKKMKMEDVFSAFETATNEKFSSYEAKFANYESKFAGYEAKLNKAYNMIEGLIELSTKLSETPTGTPDPSVSSNFSQQKNFSYDVLFGKK